MKGEGCNRIAFADLTDYAAGELSEAEAAAVEEHLFACVDCGARAAELDALVQAIPAAARSSEIGRFVTDDVLNQLARDGVRVRSYVLSPDAVVPCAVWDDDDVMALRLRADFGEANEFALSQRIAGAEVSRATGHAVGGSRGEIIFAIPAAWVRQLPVARIDVLLSAHESGEERPITSYTLVHEGSLRR
jgi:anti-sigma factor RsiW